MSENIFSQNQTPSRTHRLHANGPFPMLNEFCNLCANSHLCLGRLCSNVATSGKNCVKIRVKKRAVGSKEKKSRRQRAYQWTVNTFCRARLYANGTSAAGQVRSGPTNNLVAWRHIATNLLDHPRIYITRHSNGWFHIWNCVHRFFCRRKCNWCVFRFRCHIRRGHLVGIYRQLYHLRHFCIN